MFGWFKKNQRTQEATAETKASEFFATEAVAADLASPDAGLLRIGDFLRLDTSSWGFEENLPNKLLLLQHVALSAGGESGRLRRLVSPKIPEAQLSDALLLEYEALSDFGRGMALLAFCVGSLSSFYGRGREAILKNAVGGDGTEFRCIIFCCKAFELYGDDPLVAQIFYMALPQIAKQLAGFEPESTGNKFGDAVQADIDRIGRHIDWLFYAHYRPKQQPDVSTRNAEEKKMLDLDGTIALAESLLD